ncbi:5'-nucleotidase [Ruaniaceae bacterium KH17]|nr:5'-nucleotidase [Ruaniaceae bacterium KH17]
MFLRKSARAVAAAAALTLAAAVPAIAAPEDPETPETLVAALDAADASDGVEGADDGLTPEGGVTDGEAAAAQAEPAAEESSVVTGAESPAIEAPESTTDAADDDGVDGGTDSAEVTDGVVAESLEISPLSLPADGETVSFTVANITDFHGRLGSRDRDGNLVGPGLALACYVDANPDAFLTSSGDNIGASLFVSAAQDDYPTLDFLNTYGVNISALGNHELDRGWQDFDEKAAYATFPYLAANLTGPETGSLGDYEIFEFDGVNVAFVGAVTASLRSLISPSIVDGNELTPIAPVVNEIADELKDSGAADIVVALVHEDPGVYIGELSESIDIVFGGHSHLQFNNEQTSPTLAMQAASYGSHVAEVEVTIDSDGEVTFVPTLVPLASGASDVTSCDGPVANSIRTQLADALSEADRIGSQPLGYIADDFKRGFAEPGVESRGEESTVGSLVADAQLWAGQQTPAGADATISFMNPGGLRTDLSYGDDGLVTLGKAATMQPFANTLFALTLTGQDIVDILEQQKQPAGVERPYLKMGVAGLSYLYDPESYEVIDVKLDSGEAFSLDAEYRVITNSFLKDGGDNFPAFLNGTNVQDTGLVDLNAFIDFMAEFASQSDPIDPHGPVYGPQRSIGLKDVGEVPADSIDSGQEIALDLAGLWYTNDEPSNVQELEVLFDGASLGTFQVAGDQADLDARMTNYGRAEVRVTVPDLSGYADGDEVMFQILGDGSELLAWSYVIEGSQTPTDEPTDGATTPPTDGTTTPPTDGATTPPTDGSTTPPGGTTPDTGANVGGPLIAAMLLLGAGAVFLGARRKMSA